MPAVRWKPSKLNPFHNISIHFCHTKSTFCKLNILLDIISQKKEKRIEKRIKVPTERFNEAEKSLKEKKESHWKINETRWKDFSTIFFTSHCLHFCAPPLLTCLSLSFCFPLQDLLIALHWYFFLFQYTLLISQWCMRNFAYLINPINAWEMKFSYIGD